MQGHTINESIICERARPILPTSLRRRQDHQRTKRKNLRQPMSGSKSLREDQYPQRCEARGKHKGSRKLHQRIQEACKFCGLLPQNVYNCDAIG